MIIRWREWSSDRHGRHESALASATGMLTYLSIFPSAGELTNAYRSVYGAPSRRAVK